MDKDISINENTNAQIEAYDGKKTENKYSLYTEKIENKQDGKKNSRFIKFIRVVIYAVVFGVIAGYVIAIVYPSISSEFGGTKKGELRIVCDEGNAAVSTDNNSSAGTNSSPDGNNGILSQDELEQYSGMVSSLKKISTDVSKSVITINIFENGLSEFSNDMRSVKKTAGLIIGDINGYYMILTDYYSVNDKKLLLASFSDSTQIEATYVGAYPSLGMAVIKVDKKLLPSNYDNSVIKVAKFENSYKVAQGDLVIAVGKFNETLPSVEYGFVINTDRVSAVDNEFNMINTGITCSDEDYGFIFSGEGNVVGIMTRDSKGKVRGYGISSVKTIVEDIANEVNIVYMGVTGEDVTETLSKMYNLPMGIYIHQVEMNSPAYQAGLQSGDIITSVNGNTTLTIDTFSEKLYQCSSGQQVSVNVKRKGKDEYKDLTFTITLGVR